MLNSFDHVGVPLSLSGKVALISGGSRGIGAATVRMFAAAGAKVVFSYRSARAQAGDLAKECGAHAIASDLNTPETARALVAESVEHFGRLDILVANHGVWPVEDVAIEKMSDAQWGSTLSINLDGVFGLVKHAVAQMKSEPRIGKAPAGHIVLISSTSGQRGEAFNVDYSARKGAIISMTKSLSTELASAGIYVNCVAPAYPRSSGLVRHVGPPLPLMQISLPGKVRTSNPARRRRSLVLAFSSIASRRPLPSARTLQASVSRSLSSISMNL